MSYFSKQISLGVFVLGLAVFTRVEVEAAPACNVIAPGASFMLEQGSPAKFVEVETTSGVRKTFSVAFTGVQGRFVQLRVSEVGANCAAVSSRDVRFAKMTDEPYVMADGEFKLGIVADWLDARGNRRPYLMVSNLQ